MPDNLTDLKTTYDGLPFVSTWNTDKYKAGWQVQQVRNGGRFVPCLPLPAFNPGGYRDAANPKFIDEFLNRYAVDLAWIGEQGLPICLRYDNLCQLFKPEWDSGRCAQAGVDLANSPYMLRLRELVPSPVWGRIVDNNEGCAAHRLKQYRGFGYGFHSTAWPDSDFSMIGYGDPLKDVDYRYDANRVDFDGYTTEALCFDAMSPSLYSMGPVYGDFGRLWPSEILNMIPQWEWAEANREGASLSREVSLKITPNAIKAGALVHEPMTAERYAAFATWLLWSIRTPGIPTTLRWFQESTFGPDRILGTETAGEYLQAITKAVDRICEHPVLREFWLRGKPVVNGVGHPTDVRLAKLGYPDYPRIDDPDNRWRVLGCSASGDRHLWFWDEKTNSVVGDPMRVWAVATELDGQWLVYVWSPFKWLSKIRLWISGRGDFDVDPPNPGEYWIVKPSGLSAERLEVT